jgi:hypothetical protein
MVSKCDLRAKRSRQVETVHTQEGEKYHNEERRGNKPLVSGIRRHLWTGICARLTGRMRIGRSPRGN